MENETKATEQAERLAPAAEPKVRDLMAALLKSLEEARVARDRKVTQNEELAGGVPTSATPRADEEGEYQGTAPEGFAVEQLMGNLRAGDITVHGELIEVTHIGW